MTTAPMPQAYKGYKTGAPQGFMVLKKPTPAVGQKAKELLKNNLGDEFQFTIDNVKYFARLEPHYHPPGYKNGPNGWHKGVTVYVEKTPGEQKKQEESGKQSVQQQPLQLDQKQQPPKQQPDKKRDFISELNQILKSLLA